MKNIVRTLSILILLPCLFISEAQDKNRNLLSNQNSIELLEYNLEQNIIPQESYHPYPTINERDKWENLPDYVKERTVKEGEEYLGFEWKPIPVTITLDFKRNGNRTRYDDISFRKRTVLTKLLFAELVENKRRFLDDILNGIWSICEESFWGTSAHHLETLDFEGLPNVEDPIIDLASAETSALLALTYYLLDDRLTIDSKLIRPRIKYEIRKRIFMPFLKNLPWWTGFRETPNNWNPWINSNVILSAMLIEDNRTELIKIIHRSVLMLDNFINIYPEDGGCDEGPTYWTVAGGRLNLCLSYLYDCSNGKINIFDEPLIKNIASYIYKMHINEKFYFNTGDSPARARCDPSIFYSYGKNINDETMMSFASYLRSLDDPYDYCFSIRATLRLQALFDVEGFRDYPAKAPLLKDFWMPNSQYMGARSIEGSSQGLYFAIQGGHNDESHNHNDVGNFIIYVNGEPAIIDIGVETYNRKTFSPWRYEIWTMQSAYHNLPIINGVMEKDGLMYSATDVSSLSNDEYSQMTLDISKAYPDEAKVNKWIRSVKLDREKEIIELSDNYVLSEFLEPVKMIFMTCLEPEKLNEGKITLKSTSRFPNSNLTIQYNKDKFSVEFEKITIADKKLLSVWGDTITRIILTSGNNNAQDKIKIVFK